MPQQPAVTIPWTQADVTALANAMKQGVRQVDYGTYRVTYSSLAEMRGLLDTMVRYLNSQGDGQPTPNVRGSVYFPR
jgi:hypothetical protein